MKFLHRIACVAIYICAASCQKPSGANLEASLDVETIPDFSGDQKQTTVPTELSPDDYVAWVNDPLNKLVVKKNVSGFTYQLQFQPHELLALNRLDASARSDESIQSSSDSLGHIQYYIFSIGTPDGSDPVKYKAPAQNERQQRADYFAFQMERDIRLVDGADTLQCVMYHFENTYGLIPLTNFLIAFDAQDSSFTHTKTFLFHDKIFQNGIVSLTIDGASLKRIPKLSLNSPKK